MGYIKERVSQNTCFRKHKGQGNTHYSICHWWEISWQQQQDVKETD